MMPSMTTTMRTKIAVDKPRRWAYVCIRKQQTAKALCVRSNTEGLLHTTRSYPEEDMPQYRV